MNIKESTSSKKDLIVFLGESTFPIGFGAIQRMTLMAKALLYDGFRVMVICRKGGIKQKTELKVTTNGTYQGIDYVYVSGNVYRPQGFFERNFSKVRGMTREYSYLSRLKRASNLKTVIISTHSAFHAFRYRIYSELIGFPIVLNFVELASSMEGKGTLRKINDYIFDNFIVKIVDGALPISNVLMDYYKHIAPSKPIMKLPILCDFKKFDHPTEASSETILLYCGAASYFELIDFVIESFDRLDNLKYTTILKLVLGGSENQLKKVRQRIERAKNKKNILIVANVPHHNIPKEYCGASALMIPLRPTLQDAARFPHKIGEYLASGRPMITTMYGEIKNYDFIDEVNALIAKEYDQAAFAERMEYVIKNPIRALEIGQKGKQIGLNNFDYSTYGSILRNYFSIFDKKDKTKKIAKTSTF